MTHEHAQNETPQSFYSISAIFYVIGLVTSNSALRFISYPCQVVGKGLVELTYHTITSLILFSMLSALKPIPTMIFGSWVGGKSYALHKYIFVVLIVSGAIMFFYKPGPDSKDESTLGYVLVGISLLMNGFTAGVQEKMRSQSRPTPLNLMFFMNSWSSAFLIVGVIVSNEFRGFVEFSTKHPEILVNIGAILIVGGFGQIFTCSMITSFGVVPCCIVLTVRKIFNVLFSVIYFGNALSTQQWVATAIIFAVLLLDTILSFKFSRFEGKLSLSVEEKTQGVEKSTNLVISPIHLAPLKAQV